MDLIDKKILCELDINCRTPLSKMAKKLRIGRNVLDYRIKKLEKEKIITNYICSVNLGKLGYKNHKIYCKMKSMTPAREKEFIEFIKSEKKVINFIKTEGSFDYAFVIASQNIRELDSFLSEVKTKFRDILHDYLVSIVVSSKIFKLHKLLLGEKQEIVKFDKYGEDHKEIKLDEKDKKILRVLSQEANISLIELAEKTGYTIDVVKHRVKDLTQKIVSSFRVIADMNKIGYFHYVIMLKIRNSTLKEEDNLICWCANKKNVIYTTKKIGSFDYEINVAITDINDLNSFLSEMKSKFGNIIDSYELVINSQLLKLNYLPL
ncbi:MAG: Lrp/AsnC family transcriptional regulator [Candidatus Nanoarchaeia archaeon]|nr:Lrp/AsnC family transcriptional regulator [Candidatus Nanoarchaeia archaeon]MDD5740368.1 Lrp/AsnC family transcriptional regulator [Candidatus Nanoarchaeia archaeon]